MSLQIRWLLAQVVIILDKKNSYCLLIECLCAPDTVLVFPVLLIPRQFVLFAKKLCNSTKSYTGKGGAKTQIWVYLCSILSFFCQVLLLWDAGISLAPAACLNSWEWRWAGAGPWIWHQLSWPMGSCWPTQKAEGARSFPTLSFFFPPLPYMLEFKKLNCLGSQVSSAAVLMVCALIKYCNSNLLYGDKGKRNLRILVVLFLVPVILKSMENFCLLLLLWFTITALCRCNFLLSWAPLSAQKRLSDEL